ncbi:hypothetical protein DGG96_00300 [Legionella qingyii]|uniref:Uncharacterized protein n=1 Tax=Legionella qingyii TaxID=2184757 RepID=A0A317UA82_9GAMM|nr:hypothetical protein [Legionella qingyii]PWY57577.1 hypothetical protein DGG96_00300 [Legionella qingyii]RUR25955.1 hypothetical protein ELY20_02090 [Legionella qingyii]RUR29344.1 hypothetical protein ELY16_00715 [Legionella qingyii]
MIRAEDVFKPDFKGKSDFKGPIVLHMIDQKGYGDVSLGMKIAKFLSEKYPEAPIYVLAKKDSINKIIEIEPDFLDQVTHPKIKMINPDHTDFSLLRKLCDSAQLAVETAIFNNSLNHYHKKSTCPKIFIGEYGLYEKKIYEPPIICLSGNVGVGEDYPGILIESDLKEFSRLNSAAKLEARGKILNGLDPLLKKQVLGNEGNDTSSFIKKNSFSFSYYNFAFSYKRAATVFAASNEAGKHANYFVSASDNENKVTQVFSTLEEQDFQDQLKQLGYSKIVFYSENSKEPHKEIVLNESSPSREFRVFHRNRFTHDTTLDLMRLSDVCGVAGDQSLTEAFSLGSYPIPEEWHCQIDIINQIGKTYYAKNSILSRIHGNTWLNNNSVNNWAYAGGLLRTCRPIVDTVLTKFQDEANLYNALDHRLNVLFDKPKQEEIDKYNMAFIEALAANQRGLKSDKDKAFHIATEIARHYAKCQPSEPLTLGKILDTMNAHVGKPITHIHNIRNIVIKEKDCDLIKSERSGSFIKRNITHSSSRNIGLFTKLQSLQRQHFPSTMEEGTQVKSSSFKEKFSGICQSELTESDLELAVKYLAGLPIQTLGEEVGFGHKHHFGKTLDESYHFVEKITPCEEDKPINENKKFTFILETNYSTDEHYKITISKDQLHEFSERQKMIEAQSAYNC